MKLLIFLSFFFLPMFAQEDVAIQIAANIDICGPTPASQPYVDGCDCSETEFCFWEPLLDDSTGIISPSIYCEELSDECVMALGGATTEGPFTTAEATEGTTDDPVTTEPTTEAETTGTDGTTEEATTTDESTDGTTTDGGDTTEATDEGSTDYPDKFANEGDDFDQAVEKQRMIQDLARIFVEIKGDSSSSGGGRGSDPAHKKALGKILEALPFDDPFWQDRWPKDEGGDEGGDDDGDEEPSSDDAATEDMAKALASAFLSASAKK